MAPVIQNIVALFNAGCNLDLNKIHTCYSNTKYNPKRINCITMKVVDPKVTLLIWKSGKIVINGAKSLKDCKKAGINITNKLKDLGYSLKPHEIQVHNMVATVNLQKGIDLKTLTDRRSTHELSYEPEIFPGVIMRFSYPKVTAMVFRSGKVILSGAKEYSDFLIVIDYIMFILDTKL
jgi:transcription initiation factor TFIID TATA-box-binding protein